MSKYLKYLLLIYLFVAIFTFNLLPSENLYIYQNYAFLKGSLSLVKLPPSLLEFSFYNEQYYLPFGLFPSLIFSPFVLLFDTNFQENFIKFPLTVINFILVFKISRRLNLSHNKSLLLATFYIFGSTYTPIAVYSISSYFAHIVATTTILISIYEFLTRRRWPLIGLVLGLGIMTRPTLIATTLFFLINLIKPFSLPNFVKFLSPILIIIFLLGIYNFARFSNVFETGYQYQDLVQDTSGRRQYGLFSLKYIPGNLYYMLLKSPDPILDISPHAFKPPYIRYNPYGTSIFLLSPILFLIFRTNFKSILIKASFSTIIATLILITTYWGIGFRQIGYRYALDFFPFLLIILHPAVKKISNGYLTLLVLFGIITTWFLIIEMASGL